MKNTKTDRLVYANRASLAILFLVHHHIHPFLPSFPLFMPPRPTIVAFSLLLVFLVFLLFRPFAPTLSVHSSYYRDVFGRSRPLREWLRDEEERYTVAVQDRQELIRKYGPTEVTVDS
jgi:hypothetical protein